MHVPKLTLGRAYRRTDRWLTRARLVDVMVAKTDASMFQVLSTLQLTSTVVLKAGIAKHMPDACYVSGAGILQFPA